MPKFSEFLFCGGLPRLYLLWDGIFVLGCVPNNRIRRILETYFCQIEHVR